MAAALSILFSKKDLRRQRIFRDRMNPLDTLNDDELISRYRFPRHIIVDIAESLREVLDHPTTRSSSIPAHIQILTALRFLAKGDYQSEVGDLHGVSQPSTSRVLQRVCAAINDKLQNIKFPSDGRELRNTKEGFHSIAGFPNVIGCIDGTLIFIQGMSGADEPNFVCRKGFHAINVQAVTDHNLRFTNVVVKWPGGTHDAFILQQSALNSYMEGHSDIGWLLGDSGYPLKPWLITPIAQPMTGQQQRFNNSHTRTRNVV